MCSPGLHVMVIIFLVVHAFVEIEINLTMQLLVRYETMTWSWSDPRLTSVDVCMVSIGKRQDSQMICLLTWISGSRSQISPSDFSRRLTASNLSSHLCLFHKRDMPSWKRAERRLSVRTRILVSEREGSDDPDIFLDDEMFGDMVQWLNGGICWSGCGWF